MLSGTRRTVAAIVLQARRRPVCGALLALAPARGGEGKPPAAAIPGGVPLIVVDETAGDWVVDRFAGNSTAGYAFSQGPAHEAGGIGRPAVAVAPDGNVYLATGGMSWVKDTDRARLAGRDAAAAGRRRVESGRRPGRQGQDRRGLARRRIGLVEAGQEPVLRPLRWFRPSGGCTRRTASGSSRPWPATRSRPARTTARPRRRCFGEPRSLVITSAGTIYVLDGTRCSARSTTAWCPPWRSSRAGARSWTARWTRPPSRSPRCRARSRPARTTTCCMWPIIGTSPRGGLT